MTSLMSNGERYLKNVYAIYQYENVEKNFSCENGAAGNLFGKNANHTLIVRRASLS